MIIPVEVGISIGESGGGGGVLLDNALITISAHLHPTAKSVFLK